MSKRKPSPKYVARLLIARAKAYQEYRKAAGKVERVLGELSESELEEVLVGSQLYMPDERTLISVCQSGRNGTAY
jgi:hypothetical protein